MAGLKYFPFHPEKILWTGVSVLACGACAVGGLSLFLWMGSPPLVSFETKNGRPKSEALLSFDFALNQEGAAFPLPHIEGEMTFSFDPPRPDGSLQHPPLFVRLKRGAQSKRVSLPSRIDLQYEKDLSFAQTASSFWVELRALGDHQIEGKVFVSTLSNERMEAGRFVAAAQESPVQEANEFPEGSPFRALAEARWWGHDLFREKYGMGPLSQRVEIGPLSQSQFLELQKENWIAWKEGQWQKIETLSEGKSCPIAHIESFDRKSILFEGWDLEGHIRLSLSHAQASPFKAKAEDLFTSVRIRSEKQISCMLEKQCLILKAGDWVLKGENRWKILRKKEEQEAYLKGKLVGELFFFDRIESKGGQKVIQGNLFSVDRSQVLPIEMAVSGQRKNLHGKEASWSRKGKGK